MAPHKNNAAPADSQLEDVFQQIGVLTRQLHDSLERLAALGDLHTSADDLSDARSRLQYIVRKNGEAADKVLTAVEAAKQESAALAQRVADAADAPLAAVVGQSLGRIDEQLTSIMLAQDFHDLTGQVVSKVVALAADLEESLVKVLVRTAGEQGRVRTDPAALSGPVVEPKGRTDVVSGQAEVDALLADLGF